MLLQLIESIFQVLIEAAEEFFVMRASSGEKLLGDDFSSVFLERVLGDCCFFYLMSYPSLLCLVTSTLFACKGRGGSCEHSDVVITFTTGTELILYRGI